MALIKCPDCNKKMSALANACPKCGLPVTDNVRQIAAKKAAFDRNLQMICAIPLFFFFYWLFSDKEPERPVPPPLDQELVQIYSKVINDALNKPEFKGYELSFVFLENKKVSAMLHYKNKNKISANTMAVASQTACKAIVEELLRRGYSRYDENLLATVTPVFDMPNNKLDGPGYAIWNYQKNTVIWEWFR